MARIWFPLCLVLLLLLAIPGVVLFFLHVFGADREVNEWLGTNFQLSYQFPLHWSLGLLLLLVPLAIILLYFLRLKHKPLAVPSTFLWKKSIEDLHVNALFQWLRENVLLLLQLLAVIVLIYTVLGFRFHGATTKGKHYILMIDNSVSMATTDVKPSRLEWAKEEALKVIDAAGDDNIGMVIVFNSKATTLQSYTTNRAKLRDAVNSIQQTHRTTRIEDALLWADGLANQVRSAEDVASRPEKEEPGQERTYVPPKGIPTELHLFSDGGFPEPSEHTLAGLNSLLAGNTSALGNLQMHYHLAGVKGPENVNNVGIVDFNVSRLRSERGGQADQDFLDLQVFAQVRNYRPDETTVNLRLDVRVDGKPFHSDSKPLKLPARNVVASNPDQPLKDEPGEPVEAPRFVLPPIDVRSHTVIHAYLDDVQDHFAFDDQAWVVVGMVRKAEILRVGGANPILDAFFDQEATRKVATITRLGRDEIGQQRYRQLALSGLFDLVIFDRCIPEKVEDMPLANTMCIDRPPPPWQRGNQELKNPFLLISKVGKEHPLMRHLTALWDLGVTEAFKFELAEDADKKSPTTLTKLVEAGGGVPVVFTLGRDAYTDLVLTFPLINDKGDLTTSWPLQPSFPLFLRNVLFTLGNVRDTVREQTVQPGELMVLRPGAGVQELTITSPEGHKHDVQRGPRGEFTYAGTERLGLYGLAYQEANKDRVQRSFAVNLLDAYESNIEPRARFKIGSDEVTAGQERRQPFELWEWFALGALLLLVVEWYIYNRRIYV